jgi:hypothetical protein
VLAAIHSNMRLSGNYFERLLIYIVPWTLCASLVVYLVRRDFNALVFVFFVFTLLFWLIDTLIIYFKFKNPKPLRLNGTLSWSRREIPIKDIFRIRPITDSRKSWSFHMIEFQLTDGTTFFIIDRPKNFVSDIMGRPSKTLKMLTDQCPELIDKITGRHFI